MTKHKRHKNFTQTVNNNYSPNWSKFIKYFFIGLICFVLVVNIIELTTSKIMQNKNIYSSCVSSCSSDHHSGIKVGRDSNVNNCFVEEFDRTNCIQSCNTMYLMVTR